MAIIVSGNDTANFPYFIECYKKQSLDKAKRLKGCQSRPRTDIPS